MTSANFNKLDKSMLDAMRDSNYFKRQGKPDTPIESGSPELNKKFKNNSKSFFGDSKGFLDNFKEGVTSNLKEAKEKWTYHRFPLLELELKRHQLIKWFEERYPNRSLTKSSCTFCPFHDDKTWREMKKNDLESWNDAVDFDKKLRQRKISFKHEQYLHRSCLPLDEIDFDNIEDKGQYTFLDECDGMCGV